MPKIRDTLIPDLLPGAVDLDPEGWIDVVEIHETGSDWIVRDFVTGSDELKNVASGPAEFARTEAIKALEAKLSRSATEDDILDKRKGKSANLHWDPARGKIVVIDMQ